MVFFLEALPVGSSIGAGLTGLIITAVFGMFVFFLIVGVALWIYSALAYSAIAKKAKQTSPGLAWIPGVGPLIVAYKASGMHWWPWLLLLSILVMWIPIFGILAYFVAILIFAVYTVIWHWKMFEAIGKPGWWAILMLISPVNLIMIGIAAWSKE